MIAYSAAHTIADICLGHGRCRWCNGILHGDAGHSCDAEAIIRVAVGENIEAQELLGEYVQYRADYRRDNPPNDTNEAAMA